MKPFSILSILFVLVSTVLSSESGEFNELMQEKARIKAEIETKPSPGEVIFAAHSVVSKATPSATKVVEAVEVVATPTSEPKPRKSKKDEHKDEKEKEKADESDGDEDEEEKQVSKKKKDNRKISKKDKKSSSSESNDSDDEEKDDVNGLPKRLFRPRFRADSSANTIKMFFSTTLIITLSISLIAFYLI